MLTETSKGISIQTAYASCDACHAYRDFPLPPKLVVERAALGEADNGPFPTGPLYRCTEPYIDTETIRCQLLADGWKEDTFHGKPMLLCPACAAK